VVLARFVTGGNNGMLHARLIILEVLGCEICNEEIKVGMTVFL